MKVIIVIPARFKSTRFPGKPLVKILGKPLVIHVCEVASSALGRDNVYVATDDHRIAKVVKDSGFKFCMTSSNHLTGTDRLVEVSKLIDADLYVNIQGDEPLLNPIDIKKVINEKIAFPEKIINAMTRLLPEENPHSINIPKVVVDKNSNLLYISRSAIPGSKSKQELSTYFKQVCIYAFNKSELNLLSKNKSKTPLELVEDIEILRFLELGKSIKMVSVSEGSIAVDIPDDVQKVENALRAR